MTRDECIEYVTRVAIRANGWINTIVPMRKFGIEEKKVDEACGKCLLDSVTINVDNIMEGFKDVYSSMFSPTEDHKRYTAMRIVLHELSHCDQDIDPYKISEDEEYVKEIEIANEANISHFIINNHDALQREFGPFAIPSYINIFTEEDLAKYVKRDYIKYLNTAADVYITRKALQTSLSVLVNFIDTNGKKISNITKVNNRFIDPVGSMRFINSFIADRVNQDDIEIKTNETSYCGIPYYAVTYDCYEMKG